MLKSAAQQIATKTQMNVIKTFLIISVCFVLCWAPNRILYFIYNLRIINDLSSAEQQVFTFLSFLNVCLNPFIYAAKLNPVKKYLRQTLCRRRRLESDDNVTNVTSVMSITVNSTAVQFTESGQA